MKIKYELFLPKTSKKSADFIWDIVYNIKYSNKNKARFSH